MWRLLPLLAACGTDTASSLAFVVEDDTERFRDDEQDGIVVECRGDRDAVTVRMGRSIFDEDEGPTFHVEARFGWRGGAAPDEGAVYERDELDLSVGYHGLAWPTDTGRLTVTDFVALDAIVRVAVELEDVGDGEAIRLDGTISCER